MQDRSRRNPLSPHLAEGEKLVVRMYARVLEANLLKEQESWHSTRKTDGRALVRASCRFLPTIGKTATCARTARCRSLIPTTTSRSRSRTISSRRTFHRPHPRAGGGFSLLHS